MAQVVLEDFTGGLDAVNGPLDVALNRAPILVDLSVAHDGRRLRVRDPDAPLNDTLSNIARMFYFGTVAGVSKLLVARSDGGLSVIEVGTGVATSLQAAVAAVDKSYRFAQGSPSGGQGPVYMISPTTAAGGRVGLQYDGTTLATWTATTGNVPPAKLLLWAGNRMFAFGDSTTPTGLSPNTYVWSDIGNPRSWPAANTNTLDPDDGDQITAAAAISGLIIVFKRRKAYVVYDLDTGANRPLQYGAGAGNFAATTPIGVIFDDPDQGLLVTDGSSVRPLENGALADLTFDPTSPTPKTVGDPVAFGDSVFFGAIEGDGSGSIYEYDTRHKGWWRHRGGAIIAPGQYNGYPVIYSGESGGVAHVRRFKDARQIGASVYYDGSAIIANYGTPWLHAGSADRKKRFGPAFVTGASDIAVPATIRGYHDFKASASFTRTAAMTAAGYTGTFRINSIGASHALQLQLDSITELERLAVDFSIRGRT